jgi:serine/threonine protein kinase
MDHETPAKIARDYFKSATRPLRLGWGVSGHVYLSPDLRTAVKVHRERETFNQEVLVYEKLRSLRITQVNGITVPRLHSYRHDVKLIAMDFVNSPYLLDFAGAKLERPDFPEDTMNLWRAEIDARFGPNAWIAYSVHYYLAQQGIYYLDLRPTNLKLDGLPGIEPFDASLSDDPY